eukprot:scaffold553265_cov51-Prasinocladus_malaysianus.AAC.4
MAWANARGISVTDWEGLPRPSAASASASEAILQWPRSETRPSLFWPGRRATLGCFDPFASTISLPPPVSDSCVCTLLLRTSKRQAAPPSFRSSCRQAALPLSPPVTWLLEDATGSSPSMSEPEPNAAPEGITTDELVRTTPCPW